MKNLLVLTLFLLLSSLCTAQVTKSSMELFMADNPYKEGDYFHLKFNASTVDIKLDNSFHGTALDDGYYISYVDYGDKNFHFIPYTSISSMRIVIHKVAPDVRNFHITIRN